MINLSLLVSYPLVMSLVDRGADLGDIKVSSASGLCISGRALTYRLLGGGSFSSICPGIRLSW